MSFDREALAQALKAHDTLIRVVIADVQGSAPRETGAAMLVWDTGQSGTIGGGALEFQATAHARRMLDAGHDTHVSVEPLGPALGQCCGGTVTLVFERWDTQKYRNWPDQGGFAGLIARPVTDDASTLPKALHQRLNADAAVSRYTPLIFQNGWLIESLWRDAHPVWIHGAGHVGRALAAVLAPLPQFDVYLVDEAEARFPSPMPAGVTPLFSRHAGELVAHADPHTHHLIMTYAHDQDLEICHRLLGHSFASAGLIGSATKWARFRKRLGDLGHSPAQISRITCPIGESALGKHPQAIATGVACGLIRVVQGTTLRKDIAL